MRLRYIPAGSRPIFASSTASPIRSMSATRSSISTSLPWAISQAWPSRPKPVTSVQAWTRYFTMASRADLFRVVISFSARARPSGDSSSAFWAVVRTPIPKGLVSSSTSPGRAPELVSTLSGWTKPVTARPYFGSSSRMLWPPVMRAPAS